MSHSLKSKLPTIGQRSEGKRAENDMLVQGHMAHKSVEAILQCKPDGACSLTISISYSSTGKPDSRLCVISTSCW